MEADRSRVPFAVKAVVVVGALLGIAIVLVQSLGSATKATKTQADLVVSQDSVVSAAMTPRDSANLQLIAMVKSGRAASTEALTLTESLKAADRAAIRELTQATWLPQSQPYATALISSISAQLALLTSAGDTPQAVDDDAISRADGALWASYHPTAPTTG